MKKNRILLTVVTLSHICTAFAQSPGGVENPEVWSRDTATVKLASATGLTYVGVSRVSDADNEQVIWSLGTGSKTTHMQTTRRAANLGNGTFLNYGNDTLPELRLYSYTSSLRNGEGKELHIGKKQNGNLPVQNLKGNTAEYAVYNRQLSTQERTRVESYLALKHGLTLRTSYLDSYGRQIWNAYTNKQYQHRIVGIIADEQSGLHQQEARSSETDAFITMRACSALHNGQSLLWGDNNGKLSFATSKTYGKWIGRKWKAATTNMDYTGTDITADLNQLHQIQPLDDGESYYLAIDNSCTGTFPVRAIRYHKADAMVGDSIMFANMYISDKAVFTLRAAKDMFTTIEVTQPGETSVAAGALDVLVTGGQPPYRMRLMRETSSVYDKTSADSLRTVAGLIEGRYMLTTTDKIGNVASNEFMISSTGITEIPNDDITDNDRDYFTNVVATPNPTTDGYVDIRIETPEKLPLTLKLYTSAGATVGNVTLPADDYFHTKVFLPESGVYLLHLLCSSHDRSIKLMRR